MQRRTQLIILIIIAACALGFGIWFLVSPFMQKQVVQQPDALPSKVVPSNAVPPIIPKLGGAPAATSVSADLKRLADLAGIMVARIGSGASGEGFQSYADVMINATPAYQVMLKQEQAALQALHPASGPSYGRITRVVSVDGTRAKSGADMIPFMIQTQQAEDAGDPAKPTAILYKAATVTFEKQADKTYLVSGIVWTDIQR